MVVFFFLFPFFFPQSFRWAVFLFFYFRGEVNWLEKEEERETEMGEGPFSFF
jgi:hypothetical protein